ncbi:MAG: CRISPR-associated primase-polymerase type A1 [Desulfobacterales bacterium]
MTVHVPETEDRGGRADLRLLLSRLEEDFFQRGTSETIIRVLQREDLRRQATAEDLLRLARLAQMAGEIETARGLLEDLVRREPRFPEGWDDLLELLWILGERRDLARLLPAARSFLGEEKYRLWLTRLGPGEKPRPNLREEEGEAGSPFVELAERRQALERYLRLFSGREDCFARQWADRAEGKSGYVPERRPFGFAELEEHLAGRKTYGIYLLQSDAKVRTALIDMDLAARFRQGKVTAEERRLIFREREYLFQRIREISAQAATRPLIEFSGGKGYHFWYFFDPPVEAHFARAFLDCIRKPIAGDVSTFQLEVFPKQDSLSGKGLGNLVKLPLGIHRLTGKRSYFVDCENRSTEAQLSFLQQAAFTDPDRVGRLLSSTRPAAVVVHPKHAKWAEEHPELHKLELSCPPLGQILAACRSGSALSLREEKVLYHTVGFLKRAKTLLHSLLRNQPEYNPHMVDYRLSRLRGTPIGCRRVHSLLTYVGDYCSFDAPGDYAHPLLHLGEDDRCANPHRSEKEENLAGAIENLREAIARVERFLK